MRSTWLTSAWLMTGTLVLALAVALTTASSAQTAKPVLGPTGTLWGGEHVELEVTSDGATLEFDCATATITKPLAVDAKGNFHIVGTYTRERPGPTMRDGNPAANTTFSGSIESNIMRLHIVSGANNEAQGDYVLVRDQPGRVMKCR